MKHNSITDYIPTGRENAVTSSYLQSMTNLDKRVIQSCIEQARRKGEPICAAQTEPQGFYIADTVDEIKSYAASLERRLNEITKTYTAVLNTAKEMERTQCEQ